MAEQKLKEEIDCTMPFGKYKGLQISKVPDSYIAWLLNCNIVTGELRINIENCIKEKYKDVWLDKALQKWIYNNYANTKYSKICSHVDFMVESALYDAMDGSLPNQ